MLRSFMATLACCAVASAASIVEIATAEDAPFTSLVGAVQAAGLVDTLSGKGPFTVFAPTDDAFKKLKSVPSGDNLKKVLLSHVVDGKVVASDLKDGQMIKTLSGEKYKVKIDDGIVMIGDSVVITADVMADNGVVHIIDTVIFPNMKKPSKKSKPKPKQKDIRPVTAVDIATSNPNFSALVKLLKEADLVDALDDSNQGYTVFAPTDKAFAQLDKVPTGDALKEVLLYHVVKDTKAFRGGNQKFTTLQGSKVNIGGSKGHYTVNDANVVGRQVRGKKAVVYVIDKVLIPPPAKNEKGY